MADDITEYEKEREERIKRNNKVLEELGLQQDVARMEAAQQQHPKAKKRKTNKAATSAVPVRQSSRAAAAAARQKLQTAGKADDTAEEDTGEDNSDRGSGSEAGRSNDAGEASSIPSTSISDSGGNTDSDAEDSGDQAGGAEPGPLGASGDPGPSTSKGRQKRAGPKRAAATSKGRKAKDPAAAPAPPRRGRKPKGQASAPPLPADLSAIFQLLGPVDGMVNRQALAAAMEKLGLADHVDKLDNMLRVAGVEDGAAGLKLENLNTVVDALYPDAAPLAAAAAV